jgi:hypothetical protein
MVYDKRALQHLVNLQSNLLGWSGFIMSRPMYVLLSRNLFRLPTDPGPISVYYGPGTPIVNANGSPVIDALGNPTFQANPVIDRTTQATINACFARARSYCCHTKTSNKHVTTCLSAVLRIPSSSLPIPTSQDGICRVWLSDAQCPPPE